MASIINFSEAATIGVHSMIVIAREGKPLNAIELSKLLGKSKHHIGKVLQRLVKMGYLKSQRGPTGGFQLNTDPKDISMYQIYAAIEGPVSNTGCGDKHHICSFNKCIQNNLVNKMSVEFVTFMEKEKLQDYL
ncbi:MAG: Rrf2 family transcriptional regulator [Marinilabiliales bacterium]|nr:MAG: Rrf2 family transcriptional regulator [Marinilabiliales bacterium]